MTPALSAPSPLIQPIEDATRREFITGAAAVALASMFLAACGGDDEEAADASPTPSSRMVETAMGPVEIPVKATRIVTTDSYSAAALMDAGFSPIAIHQSFANVGLTRHVESLSSVPVIGDATELNLEAIAELAPDLILGITGDWAVNVYDQLTAIAPTVLLDYQTMEWQELAQRFLEATDLDDKLAELKKRFEDRAAQIRTQYADTLANTRFGSLQALSNGTLLTWYTDANGGIVLKEAGVQFTSFQTNGSGGSESLSLEQLNLFEDADVLMVYVRKDGNFTDAARALFEMPTWQMLPAAAAGQVHPVHELIPTSYGVAMALLDRLEEILRGL